MTCKCATPDIHARREADQLRASFQSEERSLKKQLADAKANSPDPTNYEIVDAVETTNGNLVIKARFPSCAKCSYEGTKVLVYFKVNALTAIKWKELDPHFREGTEKDPRKAPSPAARFPASGEGWLQAMAFAANVG